MCAGVCGEFRVDLKGSILKIDRGATSITINCKTKFSETKLYSKQSMKNKNILDIGTGSGIIPIICKKEYPESNLFSIDQSKEA